MAITAIAPTVLVAGVASATLADATGTAATSAVDGWVVTLPAGVSPERLLFKFVAVTNADTPVFQAGANPPSKRAGMGSLAAPALTAAQVKFITIEGGRHLKADGTIVIIPTQTTTLLAVYAMPTGGGGGAG